MMPGFPELLVHVEFTHENSESRARFSSAGGVMSELMDAIRGNDAAKVASLLDADPSLLTAKDGNTSAILLALYHGRPEIARLFTGRGAKLTFAEACAVGDAEKVRTTLQNDPSLANTFSDDGFPALGLAIFFRHPAIARDLIERGADVNAAAKNPQRVAPIHAAATVGDRDMVRLLLERGADANARQQAGFAALHTAALHGDIEMAKILVEHGADLKRASDDGKTAETFATEKNHQEFVRWLQSMY
jgi:uncharacterized protein